MPRVSRAVITGASSGIGEAFARQLAKEGTNLVLVARRTEKLEELAKELRQKCFIKVDVLSLDISAPDAAKKLFEFASNEPVDMLINNAGAGPYNQFLKESVEKHRAIINLNVTSLTELCHYFGNHMLAHGKPSYILNVASIAAYQPAPLFAVYAASKSFVKVFSEVISLEWKNTNISVTCLCPGPTQTEFMAKNNQEVIGGQGFFMSAAKCASIGITATFKKTPVIIPGMMNKLACWLCQFLPSRLTMTITGKVMDFGVKNPTR